MSTTTTAGATTVTCDDGRSATCRRHYSVPAGRRPPSPLTARALANQAGWRPVRDDRDPTGEPLDVCPECLKLRAARG